MANKTIDMSKIRQVFRLHCEGKSKQSISTQCGTSRNTVKKYIRWFNARKLTLEAVSDITDVELDEMFSKDQTAPVPQKLLDAKAFFPYMEKKLKKVGQTREKLWKEYYAKHPGGYLISQFCHHFSRWRKKVTPSMHLEHKAGDKLFIDYAGHKLQLVDKKTGEVTMVEVFATILGASQFTYIESVASQRKEDFICACENSLHFYGGVPLALVPDNLKSAVTESSRYEPKLNELFLSFAEHYGTCVLPARAYRPQDKAHVENIVKIIYSAAYAELPEGEVFSTLDELNQALWKQMDILNEAPLTGRNYSRRQQFDEIERELLRPLPPTRFEFRKQRIMTVTKFGDVCLGEDKHYYTVPHKFMGMKVKLVYSLTEVEIYYKYDKIAQHKRNRTPHKYTINPDHLSPSHKFMAELSPQRLLHWAETISPDVKIYIEEVINSKPHPQQGMRSCLGILRLEKKVTALRLINACNRARSYGIYNYGIICSILEKGLDKLPGNETEEPSSMPAHENIRGENYFF